MYNLSKILNLSEDQRLDSQTDALSASGIKKISGSKRMRPELNKMLDQLRDGDVVIVAKYDRLVRSQKDLLEIVEAKQHETALGQNATGNSRPKTPEPSFRGFISKYTNTSVFKQLY